MKTIKWLLIGLAGLIILAFVAIGVLLLAVDKGEYKQEIIDQVETHTGRQLAINGDLDISIFPWIGLSIGQLSMSNAAEFGDDPFVEVEAANIKVEVLPLLRRELRVDNIQLVGVSLDLQRDANGVNNWDDLTGAPEVDDGGAATSDPAATGGAENSPLAALAIGGVNISDARIRWRDRQQGTDATLQDFNLSIGEIKLHEFFPLSLSFAIEETSNALRAKLTLSSNVALDIQKQTYQLDTLSFSASAAGGTLPESGIDIEMSANVLADLVAQTISVDDLKGSLAKVGFNGIVEVSQLNDTPTLNGTLNIEPTNLKETLERLGVTPPVTANPDALATLDAQLAFSANAAESELSIAAIHLDSTTISGKTQVKLGEIPDIKFDLAIDKINLDDYLPPPAETEESTGSDTAQTAADSGDQPIGLPREALQAQNVEGKLTIGQLVASKLKISDVVVPVSIKNGVAKLSDMTAQLYGGGLNTTATVDASGPATQAPKMSARSKLSGVQVGPLLDDLQDDGMLSGTGDIQFDLVTRGETPSALKSALNGNLAISFLDGAVEGVNIAQSLRNAKAKLKGEDVDENAPLTTDFSQLTASGTITNGVLRSDDLDMRSPLLRVSGAGDVDLTRDYVDYKARVLITDDKTGQGGASFEDLAGLKLSIPISGPFDDLSFDFTGGLTESLKDDAKAKLDKVTAEQKEKLDKIKAEEKAKLEAKKDEAEQKAKDKIKDKLKSLFD